MKPSSRLWWRRLFPAMLALVVGAALGVACSDDEGTDDPGTGTLVVSGTWSGEVPADTKLLMVVMKCPFTMPPVYDGLGTLEGGAFTGTIEDIEAGSWCLQTYLDVDPTDGLMPKEGFDITLVTEGDATSMPFEVTADETTTLAIELELVDTGEPTDDVVDPEDTVGETVAEVTGETTDEETAVEGPGAEDIWVRALVECPTCTTDAAVLFFGYEGPEMGTIPTVFETFADDVAFPMTLVVTDKGLFDPGPFDAIEYTFAAYQDLDGSSMTPGEGEPVSQGVTITLVPGQWNDVTLVLE